MKKIVLPIMLCALVLCGCSTNTTNTTVSNETKQNYSENKSVQSSTAKEAEISGAGSIGVTNNTPVPNEVENGSKGKEVESYYIPEVLNTVIRNGTADKKDMILYKNGKEIKLGMTRANVEKVVGSPIKEYGTETFDEWPEYGRRECQYSDNILIVYEGKYSDFELHDEIVFAIVSESSDVCDAEGFSIGATVEDVSSHLFDKYGESYVKVGQYEKSYAVRWNKEGDLKKSEDYYSGNYGCKTYNFRDGMINQIIIHTLT